MSQVHTVKGSAESTNDCSCLFQERKKKKADIKRFLNLTQYWMLWTSRIYVGSKSNKVPEENSVDCCINNTA